VNLTCISHVWNEQDLIGFWLAHHVPIFDRIIIIDHGSTDLTIPIVNLLAPNAIIVNSKLTDFNAHLNDQEVMEVERKYYEPPQATFVLNTTEFIWAKDLRQKVNKHLSTPDTAIGVGSIIMVDSPDSMYPHGFVDEYPGIRRKRYFHNSACGEYGLGRHACFLPRVFDVDDIYIKYMAFSPWPLVAKRKLAIQQRIPQSDKDMGAGKEHILTPESLEARYREYLDKSYRLIDRDEYSTNIPTHLEWMEEQKLRGVLQRFLSENGLL